MDLVPDPTRADSALTTDRLWLVPLRGALVRRRLADDEFALSLPFPDKPRLAHFGAAWPRQLLPLLELWRDLGDDEWTGVWFLVGRGTKEVVGDIGIKGQAVGDVEIGYGMIPAAEGLGLATEAVGAVTSHLLGLPGVTAVTAETAVANLASARVLATNGFRPVGEREDRDDGRLVLHRRDR